MKVLICGGRNFRNAAQLYRVLGYHHANTPFDSLIHGGAQGADCLSGVWAHFRNIPIQTFPPNWKTHGNAAGPIRNQQMLDEGKPDLVIAFPGGKGTADMIARAIKAGVPVREIKA